MTPQQAVGYREELRAPALQHGELLCMKPLIFLRSPLLLDRASRGLIPLGRIRRCSISRRRCPRRTGFRPSRPIQANMPGGSALGAGATTTSAGYHRVLDADHRHQYVLKPPQMGKLEEDSILVP